MLGIIGCSCTRGLRLKSVKPRLSCLKPWLRVSQGHLVAPQLTRVVSTGVPSHSTAQDPKEKEVSGKQMLGILAGHVWPKDNLEVKTRVVGALGLLVGAKVFYGIGLEQQLTFCQGYQHMCPVHLLPRGRLFEHCEPVELGRAGVSGRHHDHHHPHCVRSCQSWSPGLQ